MKFDHRHKLDKEDARARLVRLGEYLTNRHGIKVSWTGDKGRFSGKYLVVQIDGELALGDGVVQVTGTDPGFLWRRKAEDYLKRKLESYLDPSVPADELPTDK